jgi:nucleoside-diphosphate-sugar epimerase/predicted dehydrogenase
MNLFVTGATGFLGRQFVESAAHHGHAVTACVRRPLPMRSEATFEVILGEILEIRPADLPRGLDAIVHFASATSGSVESVVSTAVDGTLALLRAARARGVPRFLHISSMSVYPGPVGREAGQADPFSLDPHPEHRGVYAESKILTDVALLEQTSLNTDIAVTIIRPGLVFGPHMTEALAGTALELPFGIALGLGRPGQSVPLLDIHDLTTALLALLERPPDSDTLEVYDLVSGVPPAKRDFLRSYNTLTGRARHQVWIPFPAALVVAAIFDGLQKARSRGRDWSPGRATYAVRRLYRFDARDLPADRIWRDIDDKPAGNVHVAITSALSGWRDPTDPVLGRLSETKARARAILDCANSSSSFTSPPVPVILVGAGRIAEEMHLPALQASPEYQLRAVVDLNLSLARRIAAFFPDCVSATHVDDLDPDIWPNATAVVATPGLSHHNLALEFLGRGASLLLEKPAVLAREQFVELCELAARVDRPVTVFHNHRLRAGALALWRFLIEHDVGGLVQAQVIFHSPRLETERARWLREEKRHRALIMELAIHFLDIVFAVGGELRELRDLSVVDDRKHEVTFSVVGVGKLESGAELHLDLSVSGHAQRSQVTLEFERATCVVDFFPDGFRVLPRRSNPADDLASDARRLAAAFWQRLRPSDDGMPKRAFPHRQIYREHRRRLLEAGYAGPFSLEELRPSLSSLLSLSEHVYPAVHELHK